MCSPDKNEIRNTVRNHYAAIARNDSGCCCSSVTGSDASARLGYSSSEMIAVPEGSNMGLGCGNPQAIAGLKEGETVLDLGSGGGFDCFLAVHQVGPTGYVIGVDMTPDMLDKARIAAKQGCYENVEFRLGEIEHIPAPDNSVDVIMSNCVINLSPDKQQVYREAFRVLKNGGRLSVSDVVAMRELPDSVRQNLDQHAGCVSGAALVRDIEMMLSEAGFTRIRIETKEESRTFIKDWFPGSGLEDYVLSANITALKPV